MAEAKEFVRVTFMKCLPDGVPIPFDVLTARFDDKRKSKAVASVKLWTGDIAKLSISNRPLICTSWIKLDFSFCWNNDQWIVDKGVL